MITENDNKCCAQYEVYSLCYIRYAIYVICTVYTISYTLQRSSEVLNYEVRLKIRINIKFSVVALHKFFKLN